MSTPLVVKKRRPINKKEAKIFNLKLSEAHELDFNFTAGKYERGLCEDFQVLIQNGNVIALIVDDIYHLSVRGLLNHNPSKGWVQVDMGAAVSYTHLRAHETLR